MMIRAMEIAGTVTDPYAIRAACPKVLQEGKIHTVYPYKDLLKNGLMWGAPELLLEVKGGQYKFVQELVLPRELLE
jgi:hypothetical protein